MVDKNRIVRLDNNRKFVILDLIEYQSKKYAFCVHVSEDEKQISQEYDVFECMNDSFGDYFNEVEDESIYNLLCDMYDLKMSRQDN